MDLLDEMIEEEAPKPAAKAAKGINPKPAKVEAEKQESATQPLPAFSDADLGRALRLLLAVWHASK